jgi:hypothetical protein
VACQLGDKSLGVREVGNTLPTESHGSGLRTPRLLVAGLVAVIVVLGLSIVMLSIGRSPAPTIPGQVDALATSNDTCVSCHRNTTPGIVQQYGHSTMAAAKVSCHDCHEVKAGYPGAVEHQGTYVLNQPSTAMCAQCHADEVAQFQQSRRPTSLRRGRRQQGSFPYAPGPISVNS